MMSDIVISGYHGFANSGDEALLWAILNTLKQKSPDISVTVLSKTPEETARDYGVKSVNRYNFFKIKKEMKQAKMLIFGGGSLLQDVTSSKSLKYYLMIIALAERCGLKTMLYANGIGFVMTAIEFLKRLGDGFHLGRVDVLGFDFVYPMDAVHALFPFGTASQSNSMVPFPESMSKMLCTTINAKAKSSIASCSPSFSAILS